MQSAGVVPDAVRFVIEGRLALAVVAGGDRIEFGSVEPGDYIGQTALTHEQAFAQATAAEVTTLVRVPLESIDRIVKADPAVARDLGTAIERKRRLAEEALATAGIVRGSLDR